MNPEQFDLVVLGGGPAGSSGAFAAAIFNKRVAIIEAAERLGGAGANTGTIPSKTLRESALMINGWRTRKLLGVDLNLRRQATMAEFTKHASHVIASEDRRLDGRVRDLNVRRFTGRGRFVDPNTIEVAGSDGAKTRVRGECILIATGSSPSRPPEFPFDDPRVHDSDQLLEIEQMPRKLAVIGAGVIGAEYACTFAALGVEVHVIDGREGLFSFMDPDVVGAITDAMTRLGRVTFHWKERVASCDVSSSDAVRLKLTSGAEVAVTDVLVAAGRTSNTGELSLEAAGLKTAERGLIEVDANYRTHVPHIYAAGDVIGAPALAATGMEQARVAVCHAFKLLAKETATIVPTGIYTIPEASMVGETEHSLREKGVDFVTGRADYSRNARGRIIGDEAGFLKLIFRRTDLRLLGVHAVGEQATELVHVGMMAMLTEGDAHLFSRACFNYPTLGDLYKHAAYEAILKQLNRV